MNYELNQPMIDIIKRESIAIAYAYKWTWSEDDECYYNQNGDDIADAIYYDCDGYLCNPKVLATYVKEILESEDYNNNDDVIIKYHQMIKDVYGSKILHYCFIEDGTEDGIVYYIDSNDKPYTALQYCQHWKLNYDELKKTDYFGKEVYRLHVYLWKL